MTTTILDDDVAQVLENRMAVVPDDPEVDVPLVLNHPVKVTSVPQVGPKRAPLFQNDRC